MSVFLLFEFRNSIFYFTRIRYISVDISPINALVRLIFRDSKVFNAWLYLKAMVINDDNILIQLENGYNH